MKVGVSTACLYPMLTERSITTLIDMGVREFEVFFNTSSELEASYVRYIARLIKKSGGTVYSVHPYSSQMEPFMFFSDYERRFTDMLETYKQYFYAANNLDASVVVLHGDRLPGNVPDGKYIERFLKIAECGEKMGVTLAQENVNLHRSQNPDFLLKMKNQLGKYGKFVFDVKQAIRSGYDPYDFLEKIGDSIVHIHCSDNSAMRDCMLPGRGNMDYYRMKCILDKFNNNPTWVIEVYRRDFEKLSELKESFEYMNGLLDDGTTFKKKRR